MTGCPATAPDIRPIGGSDSFAFSCGLDRACFTECCRMLDLVLFPYDVLRLKRGLAISAAEFLERHAVVEDDGIFPSVCLAMIDDGRASCPFVTGKGCAVYRDRPAACRFYPIGRGMSPTGSPPREQFVLVRESHCLGHDQGTLHNIAQWREGQGLSPYIRANDRFGRLLQGMVVKGKTLDTRQRQVYLSCLYDLDGLRQRLREGDPDLAGFPAGYRDEDEPLLEAAVDWLALTLPSLGTE